MSSKLRMRSWLALVAIWGAALAPSSLHAARSAAEIRSAIEATLAQRHPTDTPEWWKGLGPEAVPVIIAMAQSTKTAYHRVRLVEALRNFDDPAALAYLKQEAENPSKEGGQEIVRNTAIKSVAQSQGAKETDFLSKFLAHAAPQTRLDAAVSLKEIAEGSPEARAKIEPRLKEFESKEKTEWVLKRYTKGKAQGQPLLARGTGRDEGAKRGQPMAAASPGPALTTPAQGAAQASVALKLEGTWRGYWLSPKVGKSGLLSSAAVLKATSKIGELQVKASAKQGGDKKKARKLSIKSYTLQNGRITGTITDAKGRETGFEGTLSNQAGSQLLSVNVPQIGANFIARKD